ncbi:MAG TPA: FKBP-type peptidyl-prolyl cis-trans isomerase [Kofleriaceae bacterium]
MRLAVLVSLIVAAGACDRADDKKLKPLPRSTTKPGEPVIDQVTPPLDLKQPPADATKTESGLVIKHLKTNPSGAPIAKNDVVMVNYTGWRQSSGKTFYSSFARGQAMPLNLTTSAAGFREGMQLMKQGEKAMLWMPPAIAYKGPLPKDADTLVFEVEVASINPAPALPAELAAPATAQTTKSGAKYTVVKPGTGTEKPRYYDTVTFHYTAWDKDGRMFDTTEMRKHPVTEAPFRRALVMEEILTAMTVGQRTRFWVEAAKLESGKPLPGMPTGIVTYEVELVQLAKATFAPPPAPADVKAPPPGTKKTPKGVSYRLLKPGKGGEKPAPTSAVRVHYTGWTTAGRMFDSTIIRGQPGELSLGGTIAGWTEGIPLMAVGDKMRFWIPEELAYKGAPGKPQGMLVFDVELVEIKAPPPKDPHGHGEPGDPHGEHAKQDDIPAPPDVAAPPADAKKSPKGVSYKILTKGKGGANPKPSDRVSVHYTGWTTDGKMFDSSVKRNKPSEFALTGVIAGWTDAIPMLQVGDKGRFWIPEELAYKGNPGKPQGMLVFDVELLEIK